MCVCVCVCERERERVCVIDVSSQTCVLQAYAVQGQHAIPQPDVRDSSCATQTSLNPLEFTNAVFSLLNILACCFLSPQLTKLHQLAMQQSPFPLAPSSQGFSGKSRLSDTTALRLIFSVSDGVDCVSVFCSWYGRFCTDRLS